MQFGKKSDFFLQFMPINIIRNLQIFRKRFEIFKKFEDWHIVGRKTTGPFDDVISEKITFSRNLCP